MDQATIQKKAALWKKLGIGGAVVAIVAAAFSFFAFHKAKVYTEMLEKGVKAGDVVEVSGKSAKKTDISREFGEVVLAQTRACKPGMRDISALHKAVFADGECGTVSEVAQNALMDEGEDIYLDCVFRATNCPTAFTMALLNTTPTPTEANTWANLSTYELVNGTSNGYAAISLTRDNNATTGWPTLDTVAASPCTETGGANRCARISTAQQTITAGALWTVGARYLVIRATVGGNQKMVAYAQLSADRTLQNGDQLNLTYRQIMQ